MTLPVWFCIMSLAAGIVVLGTIAWNQAEDIRNLDRWDDQGRSRDQEIKECAADATLDANNRHNYIIEQLQDLGKRIDDLGKKCETYRKAVVAILEIQDGQLDGICDRLVALEAWAGDFPAPFDAGTVVETEDE